MAEQVTENPKESSAASISSDDDEISLLDLLIVPAKHLDGHYPDTAAAAKRFGRLRFTESARRSRGWGAGRRGTWHQKSERSLHRHAQEPHRRRQSDWPLRLEQALRPGIPEQNAQD